MVQMFSLEGRVALVTGGAVGIGQAIAIGLAQAGADVAIVTHTADAAQTRRAVEAAGRRFHVVQADLRQPASAARAIAETEAALGPLDILVNNAGIIRREWAERFSDTDWQEVIELNLNAVWRLSQTAGQKMLERGRGKIINIASLLSFQGVSGCLLILRPSTRWPGSPRPWPTSGPPGGSTLTPSPLVTSPPTTPQPCGPTPSARGRFSSASRPGAGASRPT